MGEDSDPQEPERGSSEHGAFEHFDLVDVAFDLSGAPFQGEACSDGVEVLAEETGEGPDRSWGILLGLADPLQEELATSIRQQVVEGSGQVAGSGDV
nr:hypothetical protein [Actinacidiphila rubida]